MGEPIWTVAVVAFGSSEIMLGGIAKSTKYIRLLLQGCVFQWSLVLLNGLFFLFNGYLKK